MNIVYDLIDIFLAESGHKYTKDPKGYFEVIDYREDNSQFNTVISVNNSWVDLASGVASSFTGTAKPMNNFRHLINTENDDRPLAKYVEPKNTEALILRARFPAYAHSDRLFADHLVDFREAQVNEVPELLRKGQDWGVQFKFGINPT